MSRFIMSVAVVAALFVATQAKADFSSFEPGEWDMRVQQFLDWRVENGAMYAADAKVEVLFKMEKDGAQGLTNGATSWWSMVPEALYLRPDTTKNPNEYWLNLNGDGFAEAGVAVPNVLDLGIIITGSSGSRGIVAGVTGVTGWRKNMSLYIDGLGWAELGFALHAAGGAGLEIGDMKVKIDQQIYLNGQAIRSDGSSAPENTLSNANDKQMMFLWSDIISEMLGGGGDGSLADVHETDVAGFRFANALRNQNGLAFVAVTGADVPEPATMALMGLGLTGLGIARRRMKK